MMNLRVFRELENYYTQSLLARLQHVPRPYWSGLILVLFRFAIHFELILSTAMVTHLQTIDIELSQIIDSIIIDQSYYSTPLLYVLLGWNCLFIASLVADCVFSQFQIFKSVQSHLLLGISITDRIYNYVLFMPSTLVSLEHLESNTPVAVINFILTLTIAAFISTHDQDFSFNSLDSLAKRQSLLDSLLVNCFEVSCAISRSQLPASPKEMLIMPFIAALFLSMLAMKTTTFELYSIRVLNLTLYFFLLLSIATIFSSMFYTTLTSFSIIFLSCAMFSFKFAKLIIDRQENIWRWKYSNYVSAKLNSPDVLDYFLRSLIRKIPVDFSSYSEKATSIILELLSVQHMINCEEYPDCFCSKEPQDIEQYRDMHIKSNTRLLFLVKHMRRLFYKHIRETLKKSRTGDVNFCLSYLNFLIEVYQDKILSFSEIIRLKSNIPNLSLRQQAQFFSAFQKASSVFMKKSVSTEFEEKKKVTKQRFSDDDENDAIITSASSVSYNEDVNLLNYFLGIEFDEKLNVIESNFNQALQQKSALLVLLFSDHIDLLDLQNKGNQLIAAREKLKHELTGLFKVNYNSHKLTFYTETFSSFFGFGQNKRSLFNKHKAKQAQAKLQIDPSIFSKNTCVVFLTLIGEIGTVKHVQYKFENIFGYPIGSVLKKNISMILPLPMRKLHEEVILDYLRNPENSNRNAFELLIAQNNEGWAVPVSLKFKPDNLNLEDCGLTGFLEKPQTDYNYIQTSCNTFQVEIMSQHLFDNVFDNLFTQSELYKIHLNRIIPLLGLFEQNLLKNMIDNPFDQSIQTIAYLPKMEIYNKGFIRFHFYEPLDSRDLEQYVKQLTVEHYDIYYVKLRLYQNIFKKISFNVLEVHSFKKIVNYDSQKEALLNFKTQLKSLLKISFDIQKDLEIIDILKELQSIHQVYLPFLLKEEEEEQIEDSKSEGGIIASGALPEDEQEPIQAHRDLSFKDETNLQFDIDVSKYSQQQLFHLGGNSSVLVTNNAQGKSHMLLGEVGDSQLIHGSTHILSLNKFQEISELGQGHQFHELDHPHQQANLPTIHQHAPPVENQNEQLIQLQQTGLISPMSAQSLQEQGLNSPLSSQMQLFSNRNTLGITSPRLNTQLMGLNSPTALVSPHHAENAPLFKKTKSEQHQSAMSFSNSKGQLQKQQQQGTNKAINNNKATKKQHTSVFQSPKDAHSAEMTQILIDFYDSTYKSQKLKRGLMRFQSRQANSTNKPHLEDSNSSPTDHTSYYPEQDTSSKFIQMLKEKVRQAKIAFNIIDSNANNEAQQKVIDLNNISILELPVDSSKRLPELFSSNSRQYLHMESKLSTAVDNSATKITRHSREKKIMQVNEVSSEGGIFTNSDAETDPRDQVDLDHSRMFNQATSSLHSSQTQNQEHTKTIIRQVNSRKRNLSLFFLIIFGIFAVIGFSALVVAQYIQNISSFSTAETNFEYLPWALSQRFFFSRVFNYQMTRVFVESPYFASLYGDTDYLSEINAEFVDDIHTFKENTATFFNSNLQDTTYFKYTLNSKLTYAATKDVLLIANPLVSVSTNKVTQSITLQYFMFRLIAVFWQTYEFGRLEQQILLQDNFINFINTANGILALVRSSVLSIISTIESQALTIMVLVIICVFVLGLIIIPLNVHIQRKNEEVLKLFATLSSQSLNNMYYPIQVAINTIVNSAKNFKFSVNTYKKRKANSTTSSLPKIQGLYFLFISVGIILMIIQPIVSFIYIQNFYDEAEVLSDITATLYNTKVYLASLQAVHSSDIVYLLGAADVYNPSYFTVRVTALNTSKTSTLNTIYASVQKAQATSRYEQSLYDEFFFKITSGDVCAAMKNFPQFIASNLSFDVELCETAQDGLLTSGFQISVNYIANTYSSLSSLYAISDQAQFRSQFMLWEESVNMKDFYNFFDLVTTSIEVMKDFLQQRIFNFIADMKRIFLILLIYQLAMMAFIFYFGYVKFYLMVEQEMFATKRLLNVLSIESVIENPYIVSYLTKQD